MLTNTLTDAQIWEAEMERADSSWMTPFEDNTLEHKQEIIEEFLDPRYTLDTVIDMDADHLDYCRQLAGGN